LFQVFNIFFHVPIRCQCSFVHADFGKHTYREARFYAKKGNHESHRGNTIFWRRL